MPLNCDPSKTFSADCIAQVAVKAGFGKDKKTLETAVAIALAESSGRNKAVSPTGCCHGLWQINTEVHKSYTKSQMQDPQANANAAWKISESGTKWSPWSVYNNGMYLAFLPTAKGAANRVATSDGTGSPSVITDALFPEDPPIDGLDALSEIVEFPELVRAWVSDRNNIIRVAKVLAGIMLVIAGAVIVVKAPLQNAAGGIVKGVLKK